MLTLDRYKTVTLQAHTGLIRKMKTSQNLRSGPKVPRHGDGVHSQLAFPIQALAADNSRCNVPCS